ncbi:hypothetical protein [Paenibacillus sp.]|uniref:hypothetical protein n=1 Tax=Paenibacillus sp. TaxID=58172 RepID=UPI002D63D0C4|nr:hypothetical protein [Paenibacillus sp.]HZG56013.1 hypothetical protein [Paenibacillus sp.]
MNPVKFSRFVLRSHGTFLLALTALMLVLSTIGLYRGTGPFAFLHADPMVDVGLFQAYSLMMVVGIALWIGSLQPNPWAWDVVGLLAHVSPLVANFMFAEPLAEIGLPSTVPLHTFFIAVELAALGYYRYSRYNQ